MIQETDLVTSANTTLGFLWAFRPHVWCIFKDSPQNGVVLSETTPKWCQIQANPPMWYWRTSRVA